MKNKNLMVRVGVVALIALCVTVGAVLAAGAGTESDPLITLSYLDTTATPAILAQVDKNASDYEQALAGRIDDAIQGFSDEMNKRLEQQGELASFASYKVVTLKKGQVLNLDIGGEVMLRVGSAVCVTPSSPGLINITDGSVLENGKDLTTNHLYMATVTGRGVKATAATTKVLVRGSYKIG